jgi:hypothetical protein
MRKAIYSWRPNLLLSALILTILSCHKEMSASNPERTPGVTTSTSSTIAVAVDSAGTDSVYILQQCDHGFYRDSIASASLPDSVLSFLNANYSDYGFQRAFEIRDSAGMIEGYVVIISFNGKPVGLLFDGSGRFSRVLEQREHGDLEGDGWHHGGRFGDRDGKHKDTLAITSLPASVSSYMATNYPSDTFIKAYQNRDSSILIISRDDGLFATVFGSSGNFVKRMPLTPDRDMIIPPVIQSIVQDSLPSPDLNFLTTTYPNYVFESSLTIITNRQIQGYAVLIDADNTKYVVWFDAAGNVVATQTIW